MKTESINAEEAFRKSEERYRQLLASVTDYIYSVRLKDGVVIGTLHGPGCLAVTGYRPEEYQQDPDLWHRMVHRDDTAAVVANAAEMARGKVPPTIEHRIFHRDGSIRWVRNQRVPHYTDSGELAGYDGLVSDITSRKEAEEKLTQALASLTKSHDELKTTQMQLIEAEKMQTIGRLAAGVAHEVKNPLAVLQMGLGFLAKEVSPENSSAEFVLKEMGEAVVRADRVVSDLLEFAAPKELELEETELEPLIRQSLRFARHELQTAKVSVLTSFAGRLPTCRLDRNKMKQVLVNLFVNAAHAMPRGGTLTVATGCYQLLVDDPATSSQRPVAQFRAGDVVFTIEITDTGTGIPAELLSRVFDPYFTTKPTGKGTGLGLTVTKAIVDLHGGRICINNRSEGGVAVTITLKNRSENERS